MSKEEIEAIPPTFVERPHFVTVNEGEDVAFEGKVVANPEPDVRTTENHKY